MTKSNLRRSVPVVVLVLFYCFSARTQPIIENVNSQDMKQAIESESGVVVLDVRQPSEMAVGKIPGAENIDIKQDGFWLKFKALSREKKYFVYSDNGGLGTSAARVMKQMGFKKVYNLLGGFQAWKSEGFLIE